MKPFKEIFESINVKSLEENIQTDIKVMFKGNKEYDKMKNAAKKNVDNIPNFLDFIFNVVGEDGMEKLSKKYKIDYDKLAKELLK